VCQGRRKQQNQCGTLKREGEREAGREAGEQIFIIAGRCLRLVELLFLSFLNSSINEKWMHDKKKKD